MCGMTLSADIVALQWAARTKSHVVVTENFMTAFIFMIVGVAAFTRAVMDNHESVLTWSLVAVLILCGALALLCAVWRNAGLVDSKRKPVAQQYVKVRTAFDCVLVLVVCVLASLV